MDALTANLSPVDRALLRDAKTSLEQLRGLRGQTDELYRNFKHTSHAVYGAESVRETLEKLDDQLLDMKIQTEELEMDLLKKAYLALARTLAASEKLAFLAEDTTWGHVLVFEGTDDETVQKRLCEALVGALKPYQKLVEYDLVFHRELNFTAFTFFTDSDYVDSVLKDIAEERAA